MARLDPVGGVLAAFELPDTVLSRQAGGDLRSRMGHAGTEALPIFGADAIGFAADKIISIDTKSCAFPVASLAELPAGEYTAVPLLWDGR